MKNNSVNAADVKAENQEITIPFTFHGELGKQFILDHRNNTVIFKNSPNEEALAEALEILKKEGYGEDVTLDHLVGYSADKFLIVTNDLHFSVKSDYVGKVIRPNKATLHFDLLVVQTNEGVGDNPAFIGYPISDKTSMSEYEISFQYEEGGPRYFVYPTMVYYVPDDEGYKLLSEEVVPNNIIHVLRERELDYIRFEGDIKYINVCQNRFKELFHETVKRHNEMLK